MENQIKTAYVLADQDAPKNQENLIEQVFCGTIKPANEDELFLFAIQNKKYRDQILKLLYK